MDKPISELFTDLQHAFDDIKAKKQAADEANAAAQAANQALAEAQSAAIALRDDMQAQMDALLPSSGTRVRQSR